MSNNKKTSAVGPLARVEMALNAAYPAFLTMSQIAAAAELDKLSLPEVSASLAGLRAKGRLKERMGPASSAKGRRFVKHYQLVPKRPQQLVVVSEVDLRRQLAQMR